MALSYLLILFIIIGAVSGIGIISLYKIKNDKFKNIIFYFLAIWSIVISFINVTSLPSNYLIQQIIGCSFGILAILAVIINIKKPEKTSISYLLVTASILCSLVDLYLL